MPVRYRADRPSEAEIDAILALFGRALWLGGLGVIFTLLGAGLLAGWLPA